MKRSIDSEEDQGQEKRRKVLDSEQQPRSKSSKPRPSHSSNHQKRDGKSRPRLPYRPQKQKTFAVRPTSTFNGNFPFFEKPQEIGHFSLKVDKSFANDASRLRYYLPPKYRDGLNFDLRKGYEIFVKRNEEIKDRLNNLLKWILSNKKVFLRPEKTMGVSYSKSKQDDLIESLGVDFLAWRGHFTKFLCTAYENREGWEMAATLFRGTIYISEVETEQDRKRRQGMNYWEKMCTYGGYKFEQYVTSEDGKKSPDTVQPVNNLEAYCSVIRSQLCNHQLLYGGEVDCCELKSQLKPPENYVELKTSRLWYTPKNKSSFHRFKLLRWWAQSFLVGIPKVVCGFRNDDGVVEELKDFKTAEMPELSMGGWDGSVCFNLFEKLLNFIKTVTVIDDPSVVYLLERKPGDSTISYTVHKGEEHRFLPEWYTSQFLPELRPVTESTSSESSSSTSELTLKAVP